MSTWHVREHASNTQHTLTLEKLDRTEEEHCHIVAAASRRKLLHSTLHVPLATDKAADPTSPAASYGWVCPPVSNQAPPNTALLQVCGKQWQHRPWVCQQASQRCCLVPARTGRVACTPTCMSSPRGKNTYRPSGVPLGRFGNAPLLNVSL